MKKIMTILLLTLLLTSCSTVVDNSASVDSSSSEETTVTSETTTISETENTTVTIETSASETTVSSEIIETTSSEKNELSEVIAMFRPIDLVTDENLKLIQTDEYEYTDKDTTILPQYICYPTFKELGTDGNAALFGRLKDHVKGFGIDLDNIKADDQFNIHYNVSGSTYGEIVITYSITCKPANGSETFKDEFTDKPI